MICVIAKITTKPGRRTEMLEAFNANLSAVRAEAGCIEYGPMIDADVDNPAQTRCGPDMFVIVEKWKSTEALNTHMKRSRPEAYARTAKELITAWEAFVLTAA